MSEIVHKKFSDALSEALGRTPRVVIIDLQEDIPYEEFINTQLNKGGINFNKDGFERALEIIAYNVNLDNVIIEISPPPQRLRRERPMLHITMITRL